jgi:steroid 5-alpha reductase family enzyme
VGYGVFTIGLLFEWIGDEQLKSHIANPDPNKGKFCKIGLWRYTRHPNYFGDALLWWGFYFMALALPQGYLTFFGPLVMTLLLRYVSGVRLLERKQRKHEEFAAYAAETNAFIPWCYNAAAAE